MANAQNQKLRDLVEKTASQPVIAEINAIATAVRNKYEPDIFAILGYGSCLRGELVEDTLVDLYVLVEDYAKTHKNIASRMGNRLLPPNVYYLECTHNNEIIRCKFAVITLTQFEEKVSTSTQNPYFWARFAQPTALIHARDDHTRNRVIDALTTAVTTTHIEAKKLATPRQSTQALWTGIFAQTYRTELRSERSNRAALLVETNLDYFKEIDATINAPASSTARPNWRSRRYIGKALSVLRLIKAAFTFDGGADYLAWKMTRHSGVEITLTPWQRRHPILAAPKLFWQLYAKGAFR